MKNRLLAVVAVVAAFAALAPAAARGAPAPATIQGNLIVQPSATVDPGVTSLRFDANITAMSPPGEAWWLGISVTEPELGGGLGGSKKITSSGLVKDLTFQPYEVPCAAAKAKQICFRLSAHTKAPSIYAEIGKVCLPIKAIPGPAEPELVVHHPMVMGPGSVFHFSVKVPRQFCEDSFRVSRSPLESGGWSTGWHKAQLSSPTLELPETVAYSRAGGAPAGVRSSDPPCFVLLRSHPNNPTVVDKWCYKPPTLGGPPQVVAAAPPGGGPTPMPANPRLGESNPPGGGQRVAPPSAGQPQSGKPASRAPVSASAQTGWLKPDLVVEYKKAGGGWAGGFPAKLVVKNRGKTASGSSTLRLSKPGAAPTLVPVGPIDAQSYIEITITTEMWLYAGGGTMTADAMNQVDEANETNNATPWVAPR